MIDAYMDLPIMDAPENWATLIEPVGLQGPGSTTGFVVVDCFGVR